ncbi:exopolyphosphatase [Alicyclobacillus acidoterrestris]|uniref:Ppx/GppA phosphatase family protein n=1 Tax=Alicyclobacillus suci TaxID=2816080 RepID=UPI001194BADA|nr:hypothetical protein [Alicyclobacillus suci]GEO25317.1 exopolyphosphatase [Alicyclobacillus acidoterrestris]
MRIGIIDLGSNSARLVVYEVSENAGYRPCFRMKKNIQLAQYIDDTGQISSAGIQQAVVTVRAFRNAGEVFNVAHWVAAGTAAIRQSENGMDVLRILEEETGIHFRCLSGQEEAWYTYLGVMNTTDIEDAILVDIGGASTEITHVCNRELVNTVSLPFGALTLTKKFSGVETSVQAEAVFQFMKEQMQNIPWLKELSDLPVIGTGGTARAIGKISDHMHRSQVNRLDGVEVQSSVIEQIYEQMKVKTVKERKKLGKLSDSRAKLIHAGVAAIWALISLTSANAFFVNGNGLREGLFYEYLFRNRTTPVLCSVKEHSIENLVRLFDIPIDAAHAVADTAVTLFEQLAPVHKLGLKYKELLRTAALLELMGALVNVERYKRHSDYLIRSSHLHGFSQDEMLKISRMIIGNGQKPLKQLNFIIQLAKAIVYETNASEVRLDKHKNELTIVCPEASSSGMCASLMSMEKEFVKQFGIRFRLIACS